MAKTKGSGSPQEFHFGKVVTAQFQWDSWVSSRTRYESPQGVVEVEPRIVKLKATADCKPALQKGDQCFWFAYWICTPDVRTRFGERLAFGGGGPVLSEGNLLNLLREARTKKGFFTPGFWQELASIAS